MKQPRQVCTKDKPADPPPNGRGEGFHPRWNFGWDHPDQTVRIIDEDYGDERHTCPNCRQSYVAEGSDA